CRRADGRWRGYRARVQPDAWSGRPRRRKSPSRRVVLPRRFQFVLACLTPRASSSPRWLTSLRALGRAQAASGASKYLHSSRHDPFGLEPNLAIQFLERRRGAEGFHADDTASRTDITVPAQHRSLLDGEARLHSGREHVIPIGLRLLLEDVPG